MASHHVKIDLQGKRYILKSSIGERKWNGSQVPVACIEFSQLARGKPFGSVEIDQENRMWLTSSRNTIQLKGTWRGAINLATTIQNCNISDCSSKEKMTGLLLEKPHVLNKFYEEVRQELDTVIKKKAAAESAESERAAQAKKNASRNITSSTSSSLFDPLNPMNLMDQTNLFNDMGTSNSGFSW